MSGRMPRATLFQNNRISNISLELKCLLSNKPVRQFSHSSNNATSEPLSPPKILLQSSTSNIECSPLSILPLASIIRSLAITSISSSRTLLPPSLAIMSILAHSSSSLLSTDRNPVLRACLKATFYRQFCAGENAKEVKEVVKRMKSLGFKGVILAYAKEVVLDKNEQSSLTKYGEKGATKSSIENEIKPWATGVLETIKLTTPGDFVALKFTGAGSQAIYALSRLLNPSPELQEALRSICDLAASRGVKLVFDAEQQLLQAGIDAWTLEYMKKYNGYGSGQALIYGTYQTYLKAAPSILASHLAIARREGFTLGIKIVRGAYLGTDPRHLIHDTKEDTDIAYNKVAESLVRRKYNSILQPERGEEAEVFPQVDVILAGHNPVSVRKIQALRKEQAENGEERIELVYAQLQGMADEVSCELVLAGRQSSQISLEQGQSLRVDMPMAYKYLVWGTTSECMKYLLRRAQENKDAVHRTRDGRDALARELWRRIKKGLSLGSY